MSFKNLKKNSANSLEALQKEASKLAAPTYNDDAHEYWTMTVDKAGNGYAILRFLPAPDGEDVPFVRYYDHAFKGPTGKWYMNMSLTTHGPKVKDPVTEMNFELWNTGKEGEAIVRGDGTKDNPGRKRREHYECNVYIIQDAGNPENNGKVLKYKFGKSIWEMIQNKMYPKFPGEVATDPFNLWTGCNFVIKGRIKESYRSYDLSTWQNPAPLVADAEGKPIDDAMEAIWQKSYSLQAKIAPDKFKTYEELERELFAVVGAAPSNAPKSISQAPIAATPKAAKEEKAPWEQPETTGDDESDDGMAFFKNLAK